MERASGDLNQELASRNWGRLRSGVGAPSTVVLRATMRGDGCSCANNDYTWSEGWFDGAMAGVGSGAAVEGDRRAVASASTTATGVAAGAAHGVAQRGGGAVAGGGSSVVGSGAVGVGNCDAGLSASLVRGCSAMCTAVSESRERVQCDGHGCERVEREGAVRWARLRV